MAIEVKIQRKLSTFELNIDFKSDSKRIGILGASGCGKSMTLKSIAGIEPPENGVIKIEGKTVYDSENKVNLKPQKRNIGYLFQNYALFPTMTVEKNIAAGLKGKKQENANRVREMIEKFQLTGLEKRFPSELSGGQQQRVALARIMAYKPDVILLDEPFSALDMYLKDRLQQELLELLNDYEGTVIMVSHSRDEVYRLSEELLIIDQGQIVAAGKTKELFQNPLHPYTQGLLSCIPHLGVKKGEPLPVIEGSVPPLSKVPVGCHFCTRCKMADQHCMEHEPPACEVAPGHVVKCWKYAESGKQEV